jgi:hypothetical protein
MRFRLRTLRIMVAFYSIPGIPPLAAWIIAGGLLVTCILVVWLAWTRRIYWP